MQINFNAAALFLVAILSFPCISTFENRIGSIRQYTKHLDDNGNIRYMDNAPHMKVKFCEPLNSASSCTYCNGKRVLSCNGNVYAWHNLSIRSKLQSITLNSLSLSQLSSAHFQDINVDELHIEYSGVTSIQPFSFSEIKDLKVLSIYKNTLGEFPRPDLAFASLQNLQYLYMDENSITDLMTENIDYSNDFEPLLPRLEVLSLAGNPITTLTNLTFSWLHGSPLKYLNLQGCIKIQKIFQDALVPIKNTLTFLDLSKTMLPEEFTSGLLRGIVSRNGTILEGLGLGNMGYSHIPTRALVFVRKSIKYLSLYGNNFGVPRNFDPEVDIYDILNTFHDTLNGTNGEITVDETKYENSVFATDDSTWSPFFEFPELQELDLRSCRMNKIPKLDKMPSMEALLLSGNMFYEIDRDVFTNLTKLNYMNISYNIIEAERGRHGLSLGGNPFKHLAALQVMDLSYSKIVDLPANTFQSLQNLRNLSLAFTLMPNDIDSIFINNSKLEILDLSGNDDLNLTTNLFQGLTSLKELYLTECSLDLTVQTPPFQGLDMLSYLNLDKNSIYYLSNNTFTFLSNITTISIQNNNLVPWATQVFAGNKKLRNLFLGNNRFNIVNEVMLLDFQNLVNLDLINNPFICYCSQTQFYLFLKEKLNEGNLTASKYTCLDNTGLKSVLMTDVTENNCVVNGDLKGANSEENNQNHNVINVVGICCGSFISFGFVLLCYHKRNHLKFFFGIIKNATVLSFINDSDVKNTKSQDFHYDIFLSFSDLNRKWVLDQLLPQLETGSDLKVCLHERDFQVGLGILENIIAGMDKSRYIMLIISESFLKSHWCQFELHLAQHRLLETRREDLILILLEEIPRSKCTKLLRYLMITKTYIQWPNDENDDEAIKQFWKRLRKVVLPGSHGIVSLENESTA